MLPAPPSESDPEPLRVVVIDNAFDVNHPYFGAGQVVFAGRFVGVDPFGIPNDADHVNPNAAGDPDQIHGTHVASIVGSRDAVVSGVAPDVELVLLSVAGFDAASGDDTFDFADIADALEWVVANAEDM